MTAAGKDHRFFRAAGSVAAGVGLSRITGVVREMVMARFFGASAVYDAFLLGFRVPNMARDLFAEGALSSALIPTFSQYLASKNRRQAAELSNVVATALLIVVGVICALGMIFSPRIVTLLAPGFAEVPGKAELATLLVRIMFPFLALVAMAAHAMAVLNANDQYGVPALASTFFNIGSVAIGLALGFTIGRYFGNGLVVSMACGVIAGGLLQYLWQVPSMWQAGFRYRPVFNWRHPGLRQIGRLMIPAILGGAALQINLLVNTNLASGITNEAGRVIDGPVSWLSYAFRFMQLPLGVFGVAVAAATLPAISRSAALSNMDEFRDALARSLGVVLLLTMPSCAGLAVLGESMIGAIYEWGRFTPYDTRQTAAALVWYSAGLSGYAASKVLAPAFYALNDARVPMYVSLGSVGVNLAVGLSLVKWVGMGHAGLALSTSVVALAGAAALLFFMRRRLGNVHGLRLARSAVKILAATAVMSVVCMAGRRAIHAFAGGGKTAQLADVFFLIPMGAALFYAVARLLKVEELEAVLHACYTSSIDAPRLEVGDPSARN